MKKFISLLIAIGFSTVLFTQEKTDFPYTFETIKDIPVPPVKNQSRSGTCWSFAGTSFLEAEIYRNTKKMYNLSNMFPVYCAYMAKADRYARLHGETNFPTGGAIGDVFWTFDNFGMMPETVYHGLNYDEEKHNHGQLDKVLNVTIDATIQYAKERKTLAKNWKIAFDAILNAYLGEVPKDFTFEGKTYTPQSFAKSLNINTNDFIKITSYTHHPFYGKFAIEVPDNWLMHEAYNVPLNEFVEIAKNAVNNGYAMAWGGDVSNKGFSWKNGIAIVPDEKQQDDLTGTEHDKWESMNARERTESVYKFDRIVREQTISQDIRQIAFDTWDSTDDHAMLVTGLAKDQNGNLYFKIKNSWDTDNPFDGFLYMSIPYFELRTLDITVHKNAIPAAIRTKLGIK
ncbi:MAG: aminopeptidase [Bacteroidales bacterium]|jgi:bleomycin hydrolase|nr:aminopeptidase [Bacteroidales bacterium]